MKNLYTGLFSTSSLCAINLSNLEIYISIATTLIIFIITLIVQIVEIVKKVKQGKTKEIKENTEEIETQIKDTISSINNLIKKEK